MALRFAFFAYKSASLFWTTRTFGGLSFYLWLRLSLPGRFR